MLNKYFYNVRLTVLIPVVMVDVLLFPRLKGHADLSKFHKVVKVKVSPLISKSNNNKKEKKEKIRKGYTYNTGHQLLTGERLKQATY